MALVRELEAALGEARRQATAADNDRDEAIGRRERVEVGLLEAIDGWSSRDYDSFDADDRERLRVTLNLPR